MKIGIDTRLQNETGVGRYIRNLMHYLPIVDKKNSYKFINPSIQWHSIREQRELPRIIDSYDVDLMHFPYFTVPLMYRKPFVVTIHDLIINEYGSGRASTRNFFVYKAKRIGYKIILNHAIHSSCAIIVPSQATKDRLNTLYPRVDQNKVFVTHEGVDLPQKETPFKLNSDQPFYLYVGNAYPHKNVETLIKAFAAMQSKNTRLVLVGKMNYFYYRLKDLINDFSLNDRVELTGEISDQELRWLYAHARALVLPSFMEGFGLPALEAMKLKCPVLASNIPAFSEICRDGAFYFDPNNQAELSMLLERVNTKNHTQEVQEKVKKGFDRASKFSWKKMAKETIKTYEGCTRI